MTHADLRARQTRLLQHSAVLRAQVRRELMQLEPGFALVDRVVQAGGWLRRNPLYGAAALAACVVLKPRAVWRVTVRVWSMWQRWQNLRQWIARARPADQGG